MAYTVRFRPAAAREFDKLPRNVQQRLAPVINGLEEDPRPSGCKKLTETGGIYRIRVGDFRVLYEVDDDRKVLEVMVVKIGNRADVYRYLKTH